MAVMSLINLCMAVVLWILRIVATIISTLGKEFPITVFNSNIEIALLFVAFFCFILIAKRNIIGALIYMISYVVYFGINLYNIFTAGEIEPTEYLNIFIAIVCIILPIIIFLDIGLNRNQKKLFKNKKTDWFYKNEQFDRKFDERADRNQYKF